MPLLTRAVTLKGDRFELSRSDTADVTEARRRAARAAELLAAVGDPGAWAWSHVVVVEADTGRLVYVAHVRDRDRGEGRRG